MLKDFIYIVVVLRFYCLEIQIWAARCILERWREPRAATWMRWSPDGVRSVAGAQYSKCITFFDMFTASKKSTGLLFFNQLKFNSLSFKYVVVQTRAEIHAGRWRFSAGFVMTGMFFFSGEPVMVCFGMLSFPLLFLKFHFPTSIRKGQRERERETYSCGGGESAGGDFFTIHAISQSSSA